MKKRILSMLLAFVMLLGMLPGAAFVANATENETVYISVSYNGQYIDDANGAPMAYIPVDMSALTAVDLDAYGLSDYKYDADGDGEYEITALHLSIYAHENIYGGSWSDVSFTGSPGSSYFQGGIFGFDENLNYYVNGEYPLAGTGWGATSDQIVIKGGDFVDIASYSSWSFYSDSNAGFHYFLEGESITHAYTATAGEELTVTLGRAAQGYDYATVLITESPESYWDGSYCTPPVYYGSTLYADDALTAEIDENGQATITFDEAGTYYLWADGGCGSSDDDYDGLQDAVSSPAYAVVTVEAAACEHDWVDATCTTPKTCSVCGETEGEADPDAHSYVDGICEHCGAAEPVSYPFTLSVGGEVLTITDLGTTDTCSKTNMETKEMSVTVPAGTTAVTVSSVNNSIVMMYPDHGDQQIARDNGSVDVSIGADSYLCLTTVAERILYHIYIEVAPCEEHNWNAATCTTPKTCSVCGETEGEVDPDAHSYVDGICEHCGAAEPVATPSYTIKLSEAEELTAGLNYFISVPAEVLGKDIIFDFGSGTISGMMCQRHCSKRNIHTAGEGSTLILSAETVAAHLCNESQRAKVASDFNLYLTEGSQMFAFYWWTTANLNGSYIYIEILPAEEECAHETWNPATCTTPKTCADCGATEGEADPDAHSYVDGVCEYCQAEEPVTPSYTIKLSEAEELTAGLNYFISVPAEVLGKDIIFDFGSGTISGMMCQRHCSKRNIHTAGEGSTLILTAETVAAHLCSESQRAEVAEDFNLYLTEGSQMFAFYWWTTANMNGSYIYIEFLPVEGGSDEDATYTVTLPTNNVGFSVRATSSPTVTAGGEFSFKLNIYDDYKKGENFKVKANDVELTSSSDTYTITNITENVTVTVEGVVEKTLAEKNVTVIVPAGSTVTTGLFHSYFKYDFVDVLEVTTLDDGRLQYIVPAASGGDAFIRVQHPEGVTYWDFGGLTIGKVFDITEEMLFIGSTEYTKETVYANYEKNGHDTASLYLTVNAQGWLDMDSGDTHSLNVFRNWIPVSNSVTNTGVSLPDVTYTVVDVNGNASDVVTVTPDANNSCYADIKAEKAGTAIILVTYDAVYNADGEGGKQFSAIWPENTGVIVVTVGADNSVIQTNITVNEEANAGGKQILDTEHDILFYVGDAGAEYSFKPEDGCAVTVARSTVDATMTFNGFTTDGVTVAEDGTVTISGLTTGAHIIKVEKDGSTAYQVIRAREVSYVLKHSDGSEVTAENPAQPGETITVQFSKLIDPMGKLSGVYNAKFGFRYVDEADTVISINSSSAYGEYYFGSNPVRQRFTVTVPTEWDKETYTLTDGSIMLGGWGGSFGDHRSTTYMEGKEPNLNASGTGGYASVLPDVVIPVYVEGAFKSGDLNGDAKVTARDVIVLLQKLASKAEMSEKLKSAADVNADGRVNTRDAIMILNAIAEKMTDLL